MVWLKTRKQFLLREKNSGRYYARLFADGKQHWFSLKTDVFSVAEAKLGEKIKEFRKANKPPKTVEQGKATVEQLAKVYLSGQKLRPDIKASTVHYREQCVVSLLKTWPELATIKPRDVTESDCKAWAKRFSEAYSPTRYNNTVDTLRGILETGISHGLIYRNAAAELGKRKPNAKRLKLPSSDDFAAVVKSVREEGAWCSKQCGDLIEFLAFTGCRITEAKNVHWDDVKADGIWIHGGESGTKNKESRFLPMNPRLESLIADLRANPRYRRTERGDEYLLAVSECQKAIDSACQRLNAKTTDATDAVCQRSVKRFTHHDLRHLFATKAIEAGIDVPTVAKWLGHKDGGALLMKTYSHLLQEHSQAMAAKLSF
jgi:integrase